jgi:hypothetical protein
MKSVSLSSQRPAFEWFRDLIENRVGLKDTVINERHFILEVKLNDKKTDYELSFLVKKEDSATEVKIDQQDVALITGLSLGAVKVAVIDGQIIPLTPELLYADKTYFPGIVGAEKEVDAIAALWLATLSLDNKKSKRLIDFSTFNLMKTPYAKVEGLPHYGSNTDENIFYPLAQPFIVAGKAENKLKLNLPYLLPSVIEGKVDAAGDPLPNGAHNIIRIRCRGFVAVDAESAYTTWLTRQGGADGF